MAARKVEQEVAMRKQDQVFINAGKRGRQSSDENSEHEDDPPENEDDDDEEEAAVDTKAKKRQRKIEKKKREDKLIDDQALGDRAFANYLNSQTRTPEQIASEIKVNEMRAETEKENAKNQRLMMQALMKKLE